MAGKTGLQPDLRRWLIDCGLTVTAEGCTALFALTLGRSYICYEMLQLSGVKGARVSMLAVSYQPHDLVSGVKHAHTVSFQTMTTYNTQNDRWQH